MEGASRKLSQKFFFCGLLVVCLELCVISTALGSGSCPFSRDASADDHEGHFHGEEDHSVENLSGHSEHEHHGCGHDHHHHHHHHHHSHDDHGHEHREKLRLAEELEEEEDLRLYGLGSGFHHHEEHDLEGLSTAGLWLRAMGCSLLVSMASLVCLMILPLIVKQGKPSKTVVDLLAAFGAGAMLGDAFLHQLPHALGGSHNHSHSHSLDNGHDHTHHHNHSGVGSHRHSHSLKELSVGLAALAGVILFYLVEKIVRFVEDHSTHSAQGFHSGHHHHHKANAYSKKDDDHHNGSSRASSETETSECDKTREGKSFDENDGNDIDSDAGANKDSKQDKNLRKRSKSNGAEKPKRELSNSVDASSEVVETFEVKPMPNLSSNMVLGYLNLFSDGVHNFTDGMALGSAFLLHGSVGGWSRTLFLLAHELPQEIGDFGILVRSGFSVFKALLFNFLSALVAIAGTALALLMGSDPGHSAWIEGFTAGGFVYIAMVGVLPDMQQQGISFKSTVLQLISLMSGMGVALSISLFE